MCEISIKYTYKTMTYIVDVNMNAYPTGRMCPRT